MEVREAIEAANGEEAVLRDIQEQVSLPLWQINKCAVYSISLGVWYAQRGIGLVYVEEEGVRGEGSSWCKHCEHCTDFQ